MSTTVAALVRALVEAQRVHLVDQVMENERIARYFGLGLTEMQLLHLLVLHPELDTSRALVRRTGLPHSSVGDAVERLVRVGMLTRERDENDRRVVNLRPTSRISEIAEQYSDNALSRTLGRVLQDMDKQEIATVLRYFERLNAVHAEHETERR